jgi:hypothetical protein
MKNKTLCTRCVLPESTPGISFDDQGVCNYCNDHRPVEVLGEEELIRQIERHKERRKDEKYDCLIGLSGGRDSTYLLWKAVHDYKLRVLTVNYANPFTSEQAKLNMKNTCEILGVEMVSWQFPNDLHRKSTKKALKVWSKNPSSTLIPIVCAYCKTWWPGYFSVARGNNIDLIVIGSNPYETASFKKDGLGGARTYHKLNNIPKIATKSFKELAANPSYLTLPWKMVLRMYLGASHSTPYMKWKYKDISVLRLFDYLKWNEKEVLQTITQNLNWKKADEIGSYWRFDCELDYVRRLMYASTVGVTELQDLFSKMIRDGQLSREEALERLKTENTVPASLADHVLSDIDLRLSDLNLEIDKELLT